MCGVMVRDLPDNPYRELSDLPCNGSWWEMEKGLMMSPAPYYFVFGLVYLAGAGAASRCGHCTGSGLRSDVDLDLLRLCFLGLRDA
jgi:hypothetical protein